MMKKDAGRLEIHRQFIIATTSYFHSVLVPSPPQLGYSVTTFVHPLPIKSGNTDRSCRCYQLPICRAVTAPQYQPYPFTLSSHSLQRGPIVLRQNIPRDLSVLLLPKVHESV
jgi:hypothetical protein